MNETKIRIISAVILLAILSLSVIYGYFDLVIYLTIPLILFEWIKTTYKAPIICVAGIFYIIIALSYFIRYEDTTHILSAILIASIIDILAYFSGKYYGNLIMNGKKLCPSISPKKTYTGFIVPIFFVYAGLMALNIYDHGLTNIGAKILMIALLSFGVVIASTAGDLLMSYVKRKMEIKDFSNLIPGHGGILDRLDSTLMLMFIYSIFS